MTHDPTPTKDTGGPPADEHDQEIRYRVSADDVIRTVDGPWRRFAEENGAPELADPPLGRVILDFIGGSATRSLTRDLMNRVRQRGTPVDVPYRCDAPDRRRFMRLRIELEEDGTLLFRSRPEREELRPPVRLLERHTPRSDELLVMCAWCKRVDVDDEWVEVEDAVQRLDLFGEGALPDISHGMCPPCEDTVLSAG